MHQQPVGGELPGGGAGALEDRPLGGREAVRFRKSADRALERLAVHLAGVERQRRAVPADRRELLGVHVDGDDLGAERVRDLDTIAADAAGADHDRERARRHARARDRLVRRGEGVGDDRDFGQREAGARQPGRVDRAEAALRHDDMGGEPALDVIAGHLLAAADRGAAALARAALAAGNDRRNDDLPADPRGCAVAGRHHRAADLVPERERQRLVGAHAVVEVAEVGVADAAAGHRDEHLAVARAFRAALEAHRAAELVNRPSAGVHVTLPESRTPKSDIEF